LHESFAYIACLVSLVLQCVDAGFVGGRSFMYIVTPPRHKKKISSMNESYMRNW